MKPSFRIGIDPGGTARLCPAEAALAVAVAFR